MIEPELECIWDGAVGWHNLPAGVTGGRDLIAEYPEYLRSGSTLDTMAERPRFWEDVFRSRKGVHKPARNSVPSGASVLVAAKPKREPSSLDAMREKRRLANDAKREAYHANKPEAKHYWRQYAVKTPA